MTIMKIGEFELRNVSYIDDSVPTTHDMEIVKWGKRNGNKYCYTIATFNENGEIVSCMDQLFKTIRDDENSEAAILSRVMYEKGIEDAILAISKMAEVASIIINCSELVPIYSSD